MPEIKNNSFTSSSEILPYQTEDGKTHIDVRLQDKTLWLTQIQLAELFKKGKRTISKHIHDIYEEGELLSKFTIRNFRTIQKEGNRQVSRVITYYNFDVIISVGNRVKSMCVTQFQIWATQQLVEIMSTDYLKAWATSKSNGFRKAVSFSLDKYLKTSFTAANKHAEKFLSTHLYLLTQATSCLLLLVKAIGVQKKNIAFTSQLNRASNCLIAIRLLLTNGLEETCRSITRNYLEAIDVSLACFVDQEFTTNHWEDEQNTSKSFWEKNIAYGKIYPYVEKACKLAGFSDQAIECYIKTRKELKTFLSSSVHCDINGAFTSMMVPILGYPDRLSAEPHGIISTYTKNHAHNVINQTMKYMSILLKIIIANNALSGFKFDITEKKAHTFFSNYFALQDVYDQHGFWGC